MVNANTITATKPTAMSNPREGGIAAFVLVGGLGDWVDGPVDEGEVGVGTSVTVFWEMVVEGARLLGKAEMVICEIADALEVWLPDTVDNVRLGFWPGNVSSGSVKPSMEQATVSPVLGQYTMQR
jgi:hypothetical protein